MLTGSFLSEIPVCRSAVTAERPERGARIMRGANRTTGMKQKERFLEVDRGWNSWDSDRRSTLVRRKNNNNSKQ